MADNLELVHKTFLLRCWQSRHTTPAKAKSWRFGLIIDSKPQRQYGFSSLEELANFLQPKLDEAAQSSIEPENEPENRLE